MSMRLVATLSFEFDQLSTVLCPCVGSSLVAVSIIVPAAIHNYDNVQMIMTDYHFH